MHGLFGNLIKSALPIIKNLGVSALKAVTLTLFNTGKGVLSEMLASKNVKTSVINRSKKAGEEVMDKATRYLIGCTGGQPAPAKRRWAAQGGRHIKYTDLSEVTLYLEYRVKAKTTTSSQLPPRPHWSTISYTPSSPTWNCSSIGKR